MKKILGIILLVVLIVPVVFLSIPTTGTHYQFKPSTSIPGVTDLEDIEYTYIPILNIIFNSTYTTLDWVGLACYIALFILAIWLMKKGGKKEAQKLPDNSAGN